MAEIQNPVLAKFFKDGMDYITRNTKMENGQKVSPARAITQKDPAWLAWRTYFATHLGAEPAVVKMVLRKQLTSITVPCELPEDFDLNYIPPDHPVVFKDEVRTELTDQERAKTLAAMEAYKRNPPPPILGDPSWALLDKKGSNRKLIGWHRASEALAPYTRRKPPESAA